MHRIKRVASFETGWTASKRAGLFRNRPKVANRALTYIHVGQYSPSSCMFVSVRFKYMYSVPGMFEEP